MPAKRKPLSELSPAYRKRIESAERRGLTRAEARGHREEMKRKGEAKVLSSGEITTKRTAAYLEKLAARRNVKVVAYTADGRSTVVARGKARAAAAWIREQMEAGAFGQGKYEEDEIEMVIAFYE